MVKMNRTSSKKINLTTGVPQGTYYAFLVNKSALSDIATKHNIDIKSYADDILIYISSSPN